MRLDPAMHNVDGFIKDMCHVNSQIFKLRLHFLIQIIVLAVWLCMQLVASVCKFRFRVTTSSIVPAHFPNQTSKGPFYTPLV
jgi:hypothetical protein